MGGFQRMVELIARWGEQWAHEHADNLEEKTLLFDESYESPTQHPLFSPNFFDSR